jgi:hypothetical protein
MEYYLAIKNELQDTWYDINELENHVNRDKGPHIVWKVQNRESRK